jgi:hypothetical protein
LRDPIHVGYYVLDNQCFDFLRDVFPATGHVSPGEPDNPHYVFPVAYQNVKAFERWHAQHFPKQFAHYRA